MAGGTTGLEHQDDASGVNLDDARTRLREFLLPDTQDRLFRVPTCHPARPTGFCACDRSVLAMLRLYLKGTFLQLALIQPFNGLRLSALRATGASVGRDVFISVGVWVDPTYPGLITIEDGVFIGMGAKLQTHEYRRNEFRAGRIILRKGAMIGAYSVIACGTEVGEDASVAPCTALSRDVPSGATAFGNPARIIRISPGGTAP